MPRPDYIKCIAKDIHPKPRTALCGRDLEPWHFQGIDHAFNALESGGYLVPCPECVAAIVDALDEHLAVYGQE